MLDLLAFILAAVAVIVALQFLADRTGLPAAALFTVVGLVYAVLPGPNLRLDPHVILTFVIPPLIYSAALNSSLLAIRANLRTVISLSIGLVLATAVVTGAGTALFVPGVGLAAGVALGAALSPTDPVAALAVGGRAGLPAATPEYQAAVRARRAIIDAQREELLRWRDAGHLPDSSLRVLERELDHEERTLPPHEGH